MIRLRPYSHLGWLMMQMLGALCMPFVTRDAQARAAARVKLMHGRRNGKNADLMKQMTDGLFSEHPALDAVRRMVEESGPGAGTDRETGAAQPQTRSPGPAPRCARCGQFLGGIPGDCCTNCDVDPPAERSALWWLSYADDERCAGVAIVRVTGQQTAEHAVDVARALDLAPAGQWQVAAIEVPEEEAALAERYAGRFLTTAEAEAAFAAQSIRSFEEQENISVDWERAGLKAIDVEALDEGR